MHKQFQDSRAMREQLLSIGTAILASKDIHQILRDVAQVLTAHSPFCLAAITIYRKPVDLHTSSTSPEVADLFISGLSPVEEAQLRIIAQRGELIPDHDIVEQGHCIVSSAYYVRAEELPALRQCGIPAKVSPGSAWDPHDNLYIFLEHKGQLIGRISLANPRHGQLPTAEEMEPLQLFANLATLSLERAQHVAQLARTAQELYYVNQFLHALNEARELPALMELVIRRGIEMLTPKANAGSFLLYHEETGYFEFEAVVNDDLNLRRHMHFRPEEIPEEVMEVVLQAQSPVLMTHPLIQRVRSYNLLQQTIGPLVAGSTILLPIRVESRLAAIVSISHQEQEGVFSEAEAQQLWALVPEIELALARVREHERLKELSLRDPLTGLYNRRYLNEFLESEVLRVQHYRRSVAFLMIDIDHFYTVNDHYGHLKGDQVLVAITQVLKAQMRAGDILIRYGGDEFLVIMPETEYSEARQVAAHLNRLFAQQRSQILDVPIELSIGESCWDPKREQPLAAVLADADRWLYCRKRGRANRLVRLFRG